MVRSMSLFLASVALALGVVTASDVHVHVRTHHHHPSTDARKVFHITGSKAAFDQFLTPSVQKELQFDVWHVARVDDNQVQADTVATDNAMTKFRAKMTTTTHGQKATHNKHMNLKVENEEDDVQQRIHKDTIDVQNCHRATKWQGKELKCVDKYTKSLYFNCFRAYEEIDEFFSTVTELNPQFVTKITNISTTFHGLGIDAYKLSTSKVQPRRLADRTPEKKSVYTQSLIHAREWQAGAATHFTFASLLDDLRAGDANTLELFEDVDWYFVPLVNIDGYKITWDTDRYWRINSHEANGYEGIDLNRNFPPQEYFNLEPALVEPETYPGVKPLSEPETKGIYKFVMDLPNLIGLVDMHSYGGMVLRPFSDVQTEPEEPYGSAMKKLGDGVRDAMSPQGQFQYKSDPSAVLYPAYGCFDDAVYRATNYSVAVLTIEVEGNDFTAPQETIRKVGQDVNNGLRRFVEEAQEYHELVEDVADAK